MRLIRRVAGESKNAAGSRISWAWLSMARERQTTGATLSNAIGISSSIVFT